MTLLDRALVDLENIERRLRDNIADEQHLIVEIQEAGKKLRKMNEELKYVVSEAEFPA